MKEGIVVLSLFDGISCGRVALERAGIKVSKYFASEIDKHAIKVSKDNWKDIIHIGDVTKVSFKDGVLKAESGEYFVGKVDLLLAGSPCQGFSMAGKQLAFDDPRSMLYFEFERILSEIKTENPDVKFLLENVKMKKEHKDVITERTGVEPVVINSNLVSAQNRYRLYWTNISNCIEQPEDKGILLKDILDEEVEGKYNLSQKATKYVLDIERMEKKRTTFNEDKASTLCARYTALNGSSICIYANGRWDEFKTGTLLSRYHKGVASFGGDPFILQYPQSRREWFVVRKLTPTECERLQTVPEGYTKCVSDTQRYKALGNGWTVDVIAHILGYMKF